MATGRLEREIKQGRPLRLEARVFLNLLRTTAGLARGEAELLRAHGLSGPQYNVLRILRGAPPDGLSCGEIVDRMIAKDPDVTRLLDRLEKAGLVGRRRNARDRRVVTAHITAKGVDLLGLLDEPLDERLRRELAHVPRSALRRLNALLETARASER